MPTKCRLVGGVDGVRMQYRRENGLQPASSSSGAATTPTKCRLVGGVDRVMLAMCRERHFWTGLLFPGAATTPTKCRLAGGVDRAMVSPVRKPWGQEGYRLMPQRSSAPVGADQESDRSNPAKRFPDGNTPWRHSCRRAVEGQHSPHISCGRYRPERQTRPFR